LALLVDVALEAGAGQAHLVDSASEIDEGWLVGSATVGLTAGASAPEELLAGVLGWLSDRGYGDVEEVGTGSETQTFSLPRELRDQQKLRGCRQAPH
jgi:4-hydroxy-3-methylbut-2-enyl diphosphate reductase